MKAQRGNILFLILLAVVLFAALAYAVTSSMRGGGKDASSESVKSQAATILAYFSQVEAAIQRMTMTGGLRIENISFERTVSLYGGGSTLADVNGNCTSSACKLFHVDGGGVNLLSFEKYANPNPSGIANGNFLPGNFDILMFRWPYAGTDANDLLMRFLFLKPEVCAEIASSLNIPTSVSTTGPLLNVVPVSNWDSTYRYLTADQASYAGKTNMIFTYVTGSNGFCHLQHLIYER